MRARTQEQWKETSPSHRQAKTLSALQQIINIKREGIEVIDAINNFSLV
jgi:hypothetical protein